MIKFARETGDLQTLSDVDIKLIALTYTLEAQIHGTEHLRDSPPPVHTVNVKRLPEKDMPGWGSNVPNLEEWEALEQQAEDKSNPNSKILPLKDLSLNVISDTGSENQESIEDDVGKPKRYFPKKKEINIEGNKMVADGIDASQGEFDGDAGDWMPAVSRSTHRRFLRRKSRREYYEALSEKDGISVDHEITKEKNDEECLSSTLNEMRLEEDSSKGLQEEHESVEGKQADTVDETLDHFELSSHISSSVDASNAEDDDNSEQSWMLRSLSESTVACVTGDYAMQNVLLQMGLRLVAPGGMQIRQLHRFI